MKLTKFMHSCVLVENGDQAVLFDPGMFSWNSGLVNVAEFPQLTAVVITHQHSDHFDEQFVRAILAVQPDVQWIAPVDMHDKLQALGVTKFTDETLGSLLVSTADHTDIAPFGPIIKNLTVHFAGVLTNPGDSHQLTQTMPVLLLPVEAPWGTTVDAIRLAQMLKPKYVLPVHDWMWKDEWRKVWYSRIKDILAKDGVDFLVPTDGQSMEIQV